MTGVGWATPHPILAAPIQTLVWCHAAGGDVRWWRVEEHRSDGAEHRIVVVNEAGRHRSWRAGTWQRWVERAARKGTLFEAVPT